MDIRMPEKDIKINVKLKKNKGGSGSNIFYFVKNLSATTSKR